MADASFQPYVGPRPFERHEEEIFFGRDREADDLASLIIAHPTVLLYAQSGAGKTSLLNAKLLPLLERERFEILPIARVRGARPEGIEITNVYVFQTLLSWMPPGSEPDLGQLASETLSSFLRRRPHSIDGLEQPLPRAVFFDQFEELFTFFPERWRDRRPFFEQVRDALDEDRLLRVAFVMREDYIAELDPYVGFLPEGLRTRMRLERLRDRPALEAITRPLLRARHFAPGAAEALVHELREIRIETATGATLIETGEFVEPVQLQVVCQSLWEELPPEVEEITKEHLEDFGQVNKALSRFYERAIQRALGTGGVREGELRRWFGETLITPAGTRGTVYRGRQRTGGIPNEVIDLLENLHLIRGEWRGGGRWYELSHDRFIEPILESNKAWIAGRLTAEEIRQRLEAQATLWAREGRGREGLLDAVELHEAERWLRSPDAAELSYSELLLSLIEASRSALQEQERKQELERTRELAAEQRLRLEERIRAMRWLRALAVGIAVFGLAAIVLAMYAMASAEDERQARRFAEQQQATAEEEKHKAKRATEIALSAEAHAKLRQVEAEQARQLALHEKGRALEAMQQAATDRAEAIEAREEAELARLEEVAARNHAEEARREAEKALANEAERAEELRKTLEQVRETRESFSLAQSGDYRSAQSKLRELLEIYRKTGDRLAEAQTLNNLAAVYWGQNQLAEAEGLFRRSLEIQSEITENKQGLARTFNDLGAVLLDQGKLGEAEPYLQNALEIQESLSSGDSPEVVPILNNLASAYVAKSDLAGAKNLYERALYLQRRAFGQDDLQVASTFNNLGAIAVMQGRQDEAAKLYEEAISIVEKEAPESAPHAELLSNLGCIYTAGSQPEKAEPLFQRALHIWDRNSLNSPGLLSTLQCYADLLGLTGRESERSALLKRIKELQGRTTLK